MLHIVTLMSSKEQLAYDMKKLKSQQNKRGMSFSLELQRITDLFFALGELKVSVQWKKTKSRDSWNATTLVNILPPSVLRTNLETLAGLPWSRPTDLAYFLEVELGQGMEPVGQLSQVEELHLEPRRARRHAESQTRHRETGGRQGRGEKEMETPGRERRHFCWVS